MKLIKFISAAALVASTFLVSGVQPASSGAIQTIAAPCHNWPHCRDSGIVDQATDKQQFIAAPCHNWPHCRDAGITDPALELTLQMQTKALRKAA